MSDLSESAVVLKIIDGTPRTQTSLCESCWHSTIINGENFEKIVHCNELGRDIRFKVNRCNRYDDKALPSLQDLEKIAWVVESRVKDKVGFAAGGNQEPESDLEIAITPPKKKKSDEDEW